MGSSEALLLSLPSLEGREEGKTVSLILFANSQYSYFMEVGIMNDQNRLSADPMINCFWLLTTAYLFSTVAVRVA